MNNPSIISALLATFVIGVADAINKKARQENIPITSYLLIQSPFFLITILIIALATTGIKINSTDIFYGLVGAVFSFAAFTIMLHSLTHGYAGINYAIFRLSFVFASGAGIFALHENVGLAKGIGIIFAVMAIFLFFYTPKSALDHKKSLGLAIIAMFLSACFQLTLKLATQVFTASPPFLVVMSIFFTLLVIVYNIFFGTFKMPRLVFVYAPVNGILMALGTLFMIISLFKGDVSTVTPIVQLSFLITLVLSIAFLKERINLPRVIGIISAVIAVILLVR